MYIDEDFYVLPASADLCMQRTLASQWGDGTCNQELDSKIEMSSLENKERKIIYVII